MDLFRHRKDTKIKVEFHISALSLTNLPESSSGKEYSVEIKRGTKVRNSGVTKKATVRNGAVHWADGDATVIISCRFYQDPNTKKIYAEKKDLTITLKEDEPTKRRSIISFAKITKTKETVVLGKTIINLANYSDPGSIRNESIQLLCADRKLTYHLNIKIETKWVKIDNKKLVKKTSETSLTSVKLGEEDFVLQTTDEVSETNTSVSSDRLSDMDEDEISFEEKSIEKSPSMKNICFTSPRKKRNENWEIDGDTYLSAIRISSNVGSCHGLKLRRTMSESVLPVSQGKLEHPSANLGMKSKFEDLRGKFDKELKNLKERFENELKLEKKEKEKQVKRLLEDKKRLEESLTKIEDIKIKLETSTYDLQRKLDVENKEKMDTIAKMEKMNSKTAKKDSNMKKKEIEEKLVKYEKEVTSLNLQIQQLKQENSKYVQKTAEDEKEILRLTEKTTKLGKNIQDQEVVIQDLEEQLKEFGEKFRDAMESQEAATEELIKEKGKNLELQSRVDEEQTRREYLSKVDLIEAYETQYKFQRFWKLHAAIIVLAFFICLMADNLV